MWRLSFNLTIIILLNPNIVSAIYFRNLSKVTWKDAQNLCSVPSVGDIMYTRRDFTALPETFTAWTSSRNLTSDWTSFYGCLEFSLNMALINDKKGTLDQYFPNSTNAVDSESVFKCAYFCTKKGDVFIFFRQVCKCIHENEINSRIVEIPRCIYRDPSKMENVDDVYSISRRSIPIFKFKRDLQNSFIQTGDGKPNKQHCLAKTNGNFTSNDCTSAKLFTCEGGYNGYGTWTNATYTCLSNNRSLLRSRSTYSDHWLRYFMYEEDKGNEQCVSIRKNSTSMSLNYQFRLCSDHLPVLCEYENDSNCPNGTYGENCIDKCGLNYYGFQCLSRCYCFANETCNKATGCEKIYTSNNSYNSTKYYLCSKIIAGGAVTFAAIIIFLVGIIFIQRRKLANASYTTLTVRRDQNNYNEVPDQMSVSIIGQYYEMSAVSETHASGDKPTVQQNIDQIQHIDTSGYLIPSGMLETGGDYQTIAD